MYTYSYIHTSHTFMYEKIFVNYFRFTGYRYFFIVNMYLFSVAKCEI